jgi:hypothetical protein
MSTLRVIHPSRPAKPVPPDLAQKVDDLLELRILLHQAETSERGLTAGVLRALRAAGLTEYRGEQATARVDLRVGGRS